MKNLSLVFSALILLAACKKRGEEPVAVESVSLPPAATLVMNGTYELKVTVSPINATDKSLTWASDNTNIVAVDQTGVMTGKAAGKTVITATSKSNTDKSAKCEVTVVKSKTASITIAPEKPETVKGKTLQLKATVLPADAAQTVTWSSGDETKATIDPATGTATGVEVGTAVITATATDGSGIKKEVTLTVKSEIEASTAAITDITLGAEKFKVKVPDPGAATTLENAPHTLVANLSEVQVNITATEGAVIKIGSTVFSPEQKVNFTNSVTFSVTQKGKAGSKEYTLTIMPYNKDTNPYGIYTVAHLNDMRNILSEGFKLMNNITMPNVGASDTGINNYAASGWLPIGDRDNPFMGSLNGGGFKIDNLFALSTTLTYVGLFGKVGTRAFIKDLGVIAVNEKQRGIGGSLRSGDQYSGILAGYSEGTIENCYTAGRLFCTTAKTGSAHAGGLVGYAKGRITKCHTTGGVAATADGSVDEKAVNAFAGGLVGYSEATISECYAKGGVFVYATTVSSSYAGGLAGYAAGSTINKCFAAGDIKAESSSTVNTQGAYAAGLVGFINDSRIDNCFATGSSSAGATVTNAGSKAVAGGLAGQIKGNCSISNSYAVGSVSCTFAKYYFLGSLSGELEKGFIYTNCYRNSDASLTRGDGSIPKVSDNDTAGLTPKTYKEMKTDAFTNNLNEGQSSVVWKRIDGTNSDLPFLKGVEEGK